MAKLSKRRYADLGQACVAYLSHVDNLVESKRSMSPSKAETHRAKYEDACGVLEGAVSTGWVSQEATELEVSERDLAEAIITARAEHQKSGARLEAKRIAARSAIRRAGSVQEMAAILKQLEGAL